MPKTAAKVDRVTPADIANYIYDLAKGCASQAYALGRTYGPFATFSAYYTVPCGNIDARVQAFPDWADVEPQWTKICEIRPDCTVEQNTRILINHLRQLPILPERLRLGC